MNTGITITAKPASNMLLVLPPRRPAIKPVIKAVAEMLTAGKNRIAYMLCPKRF